MSPKGVGDGLGPVFAHLFQKSNDTGEIPSEWFLANICPLFKKGSRQVSCLQLSPGFLDLHTLLATRTFFSNIMAHLDEHHENKSV